LEPNVDLVATAPSVVVATEDLRVDVRVEEIETMIMEE
jgi:hypothetical protein